MSFESNDGSLVMMVGVFDSVEHAIDLYDVNIEAMAMSSNPINEYSTLWKNFDTVVNESGIGSLIVYQYDIFFLNLHTTIDEDKQALTGIEELRKLSTIVQKKILDLDEVRISPPNPVYEGNIEPNETENTRPERYLPNIEGGVSEDDRPLLISTLLKKLIKYGKKKS